MTKPVKALISGAGIAGPALAYWLVRRGIETTVVERAPALRSGGQAVDFRGPIHRAVLERMGIWEAIHAERTRPQKFVLLDPRCAPCATLPEAMMAGDVEILRGDLSRILFERTRTAVDYRFGDRVSVLEQHADRVSVRFEQGGAQQFDFVIGADGLHSGIRALTFGNERGFLKHRGYRIATFEMPNVLGAHGTAVNYALPRRGAAIFPVSARVARALLIHAAPEFGEERGDIEVQRSALARTFAGMGWYVPDVLAALEHATDLYLDAIATVHLPHYARGRVALLGDAAYGGTLGGQGTSLAIVGAYVLAGELGSGQDPSAAFVRYERRMRAYAQRCQKGAMRVGSFFAPKTRLGLNLRNAMYAWLTAARRQAWFERMVKEAASDFALPEYALA